MIGAGGTGGHIYPGLALAEALRRADPRTVVSFVGTERGLETRLIPEAGYRLHTVDMIPFDRALGLRRYLLPAALLRAGRQCREILKAQGAQVAVGMGGYPSAPVIVGAQLAGLPSVVHESNAVPGRANRFAARLTPHVALAFDRTRAHLPAGREVTTVGMPLVGAVAALDRTALREAARRHFEVPPQARLVVFNGGSLGATRLTEAAVELAGRWRNRTDRRLLIKTGPAALEQVRAQLAGHPTARAVAYLDRMDLAYAAADLMVCRAGSATVAELSTVRMPAVLVPYPHAPHDHQTHNARVLSDTGAGVLLPDGECTGERLAGLLEPLLADPARLAAMARAADPGTHARAADLLAAKVLATVRRAPATAEACLGGAQHDPYGRYGALGPHGPAGAHGR
ncbi:UDP-N-acetylglucosamine--N-acetylmuramyl-(pentapeptide) pyrophosphoryl-undecaprenol N-acetylglucosamine transferase [Kitasatospora sp. LaBMicrA B282]|uniref:UDP-N-acetylglucosamine--N-acetylmuramyl- (pentapeptide) pyrophosphoryl-undecaprenol N-acetylglucosamine transferase n=1 Tax=Kitasatospora sp. LaBMicrA B282 TaxID=3420949 RepID=UPI003D0E7979